MPTTRTVYLAPELRVAILTAARIIAQNLNEGSSIPTLLVAERLHLTSDFLRAALHQLEEEGYLVFVGVWRFRITSPALAAPHAHLTNALYMLDVARLTDGATYELFNADSHNAELDAVKTELLLALEALAHA
jgi:DNA-binding GntR family transcriptional regulator